MFTAYIFLILATTILLTFCSKKTGATIYLFFSIPARLRKLARDFQKKRDTLKKVYFKKTSLIWEKTISKQQALHDKNTKTQIHLLAKATKKQLYLCRNNLPREELKNIKQSIKQCVAQLEMTELLEIHFGLISQNRSRQLSLATIQNRQ